MSICPKFDICSLYVDGELSAKEKLKFEQHVQVCCKCRNTINSYKKLKKYIKCNDIPCIDMKLSFKQLMLKYSLKKSFFLYKILYYCTKNKILMNCSIVFVFILVIVCMNLFQNQINKPDSNIQFHPIIPVSHESHFRINLNELYLSNMNSSFRYNKNENMRTYQNMTSTFNSFANLYSNLEHTERFLCGNNMHVINGKRTINYCIDMPFYQSLYKHEK